MENSYIENKKKYIGVLVKKMKEKTLENLFTDDGIVIAVGMAIREGDNSFNTVYHHADMRMYENEKALKEKRPSHNLR